MQLPRLPPLSPSGRGCILPSSSAPPSIWALLPHLSSLRLCPHQHSSSEPAAVALPLPPPPANVSISSLSGGEKQRVAIARAFLKAPRLLICDEATSALDSKTEAGILKTLKELSSGRTCVFVAHRLSTIMRCDKILVMDGGSIIEEGTHQDLLKRKGMCANMWSLQESEEKRELSRMQ